MIIVGAAPDLPDLAQPVDVVLLLDMSHYLDEQQLAATLRRSWELLAAGGMLLVRFVVRPQGKRSKCWYLEDWRVRISGRRPWYRSPEDLNRMMAESGFVDLRLDAAINRELFWIVGHKAGATAQ
jgi:cyclopropane fatty-acyl-phospholipid synthase-like methyltransferase